MISYPGLDSLFTFLISFLNRVPSPRVGYSFNRRLVSIMKYFYILHVIKVEFSVF